MVKVFGLSGDDVRVISPFVGGAFGSGLRPQYQLFLAVMAALALKRSVRVVLTRDQMFTLGYRPDTIQTGALGANRDGVLQALIHEAVAGTSQYEDFQENTVNWSSLLYHCDNVRLDYKRSGARGSALMDFTNPDLSAFKARGGKLVILEHMADYAQSPYAGIDYFQQVQKHMGEAAVADFARLYVAPGIDHVGSGAPSHVDMLEVLVDWVEGGRAPADLVVVEQQPVLPVFIDRALPLCRWPAWPHYREGDPKMAASFVRAP